MSKTMNMNMLRQRRRDNNVKPNRRLDRKSSRGMIYENEELRLKTININAEIERGQSDIKKLRRENEMLKKEIWYLRDEYDKLDKLLKQKAVAFSSSSSSCSSSDSETSGCEEPPPTIQKDQEEVETSQNAENCQKTTTGNLLKTLRGGDFDHLSVVPEEPSTENSDKSQLQPDESYPDFKHFFAPLPTRPSPSQPQPFYTFPHYHQQQQQEQQELSKSPDLIVKLDGAPFATPNGYLHPHQTPVYDFALTEQQRPRSSFSNGGNLEELLNDIQTISEDILRISSPPPRNYPLERSPFDGQQLHNSDEEQYRSEISVVLMPTPMPLIECEKYKQLSIELLSSPEPESNERRTMQQVEADLLGIDLNQLPPCETETVKENNLSNAKILEDKKDKDKEKEEKESIRRKVSIHFKGRRDKKKDKEKDSETNEERPGTPVVCEASSEPPINISSAQHSSDSERPGSKHTTANRSTSASPDRHDSTGAGKKHHKHKKKKTKQAMTAAAIKRERRHNDLLQRDRSASICTDRSERHPLTDDNQPASSDRERTNSLSSCGTNNPGGGGGAAVARRKYSNTSQVTGGKIPWCACWGNGCL